jgi:hypothetical protein
MAKQSASSSGRSGSGRVDSGASRRGSTPARKKAAAKKRAKPPVAAAVPRAKEPLTLAEAELRASAIAGARRAESLAVAAAATEEPLVPRDVAMVRTRLKKQADRELTQRIREYQATMALLERQGVAQASVAPTDFAGRESVTALAAANRPLRVLAEGDSWFNYPPFEPRGGLVKRLKRLLGVPILDLSTAGDEVRNMLGVEQRKLIATHLENGSPAGGAWDCFLFSGGGNDIVGNPMALWIRPYVAAATPETLIHQSRFEAALAIVRAGYEDLIELRNTLSPNTELVFHSYDFAIPDGRGVCGAFGRYLYGPWMWPTFEVRGYPTYTVAFPVVKEMLRQFAAMLAQLAATHRGITFVDTQNTLRQVPSAWHNELHPSDAGYDTVAGKILDRLRVRFP